MLLNSRNIEGCGHQTKEMLLADIAKLEKEVLRHSSEPKKLLEERDRLYEKLSRLKTESV